MPLLPCCPAQDFETLLYIAATKQSVLFMAGIKRCGRSGHCVTHDACHEQHGAAINHHTALLQPA
jgi:hypothetical protein